MKIKRIVIGFIWISFVCCHSDSDSKHFTTNQNSANTIELSTPIFKKLCGSYMGMIKSSTDSTFYSIRVVLSPDSTFDVLKKSLEGNLSTNRLRGVFTIAHDTLILHHVIENNKFLLFENEIHYISEYCPTEIKLLKKDINNILYKLN